MLESYYKLQPKLKQFQVYRCSLADVVCETYRHELCMRMGFTDMADRMV